jgi:hypothetical protein
MSICRPRRLALDLALALVAPARSGADAVRGRIHYSTTGARSLRRFRSR